MKQIKLLGVLAIALTLGLASCAQSNPGGESGDQPSEHVHTFDESKWESNATEHWHPATCEHKTQKGDKAKHTFGDPYDIVPATCTEAGSQKVKCTVCDYEKTETLKATGHSDAPAEDSTEWTLIQAATCTEAGSHSYVCTRCNKPVEVTIPALGHVYEQEDGADKVTWSQVADCTHDGAGTKECTRCHAVENVTKAALGHDFVKDEEGNDVITWTKRATCTEDGAGSKHCQRCNLDVPQVEEALGHDIHLVDDQGDPEEGYAKVRLYDCSRCDVTYLGFKATEVTADSKERLVFETYTTDGKEEQGARFFGHPIGNDCELDPTTGDPSEGVAEVYSKEQTGDYFEYKFKLTQEQVDALSGDEDACLCYVDALPANWMQQNNMDFFAKGSETDWTKAYYIDEDPAHYNEDGTAKEIAGWRYVLYVDGHYQDFDASVATNKMANNNRGEFVMPYLFKLHTGENIISLRMAAGYRCTFFNFTFRPYVKPTPVVATPANIELTEGETVQIESEMEGLSYKSASTSIATVSSTGLVTAVKAGETKITVSKTGNFKSMEIPVKVNAPAGVVEIPAVNAVINPAEGGIENYHSNSSGDWLRNPKKDTTLTYTISSQLAGFFDIVLGLRGSNISIPENIALKVNDNDVTVSGTVNTSYSAVEYVVGQADLIKGDNTLVITFLADSALYLKTIKVAPHVHSWGEKQEVAASEGTVAYDKYECSSCHMIKIEVKLDDSMLASGSQNKNDPAGYMKLKSNNQSFSFTINVEQAMTGKIYQRGVMDAWSSNKSRNVFSGGSGGADDFELKVGDTAVNLSAYKSAKWQDIMIGDAQDGNLSPLTDVESGVISLAAGNNTITYTRKASYNLALTHIVFIVK